VEEDPGRALPATPRMDDSPSPASRRVDRSALRTAAAARRSQRGGGGGGGESVVVWDGAEAWRADGADDGSVAGGDLSSTSLALDEDPPPPSLVVSGAEMASPAPHTHTASPAPVESPAAGRRLQPPPSLPGAVVGGGIDERRALLTPAREIRPSSRLPAAAISQTVAAGAYATPRMPSQ
jgi:hypothetical protein